MIKHNVQAFLVALTFLTCLPVPASWLSRIGDASDYAQLQSRSLIFYPFVGMIIGCVLAIFSNILPLPLPALIQGLLIVTAWIVLTGGLHLDGFADSVDAACASHKDASVTLAVFKDPNAGPMAVIALIVLLLFKTLLIAELLLLPQSLLVAIVVAATFSRCLVLVYILTTPYAREKGIASNLDINNIRVLLILIIGAGVFTSLFFIPFPTTLLLMSGLAAWLFLWRRYWCKKIGGYTGDCAGALIEVSEIYVLFVFLLMNI